MNKRIQELITQAGGHWNHGDFNMPSSVEFQEQDIAKFAELIIRECADTIENRAHGQMGKEGEGWTNGYDDGMKTSAFLIKKHFGVES